MHLLVIEDNLALVANLYDFLEARGHQVDSAYDAVTGLRYATRGNYDVIVLDLALPGMDGLEVCARLRAEGHTTPVLMLTARDTLDDKLAGFEQGADDYLIKPFALQELEARLQALVRRARGAQGRARLQVADLVLDTTTMQATRAGERLVLPPIPLQILTLLMRRSPAVARRQEIEREIWSDSPPDSDALRAHMHNLRAVVDKPFGHPLIHTVHGIGYRLAEDDALSP